MSKCPPCNQNCKQSDECPARDGLPITMEDEPPFSFDWTMRLLRDVFALIGLLLMLALAAFFLGYKS